jgi:hypothetical protein
MDQKTRARHREASRAFCQMRSLGDLCQLLRLDRRRLLLIANQPRYKSFSIPKKDGGERHIETPSPALKKLQSQLNRYLQSVYVFEKSSAAYGFVAGVLNDDDRRNVYTNARKHLGHPYLLNLDLKDFFHAVRKQQVLDLFTGPPFHFPHDLPGILTKLCVHKGRLPMGAPTSPVLSNFACRSLDDTLIQLAESRQWVFTRYADDLSFSARQPFLPEDLDAIRACIQEARFQVNEKKLRLYGPDDVKIITGLWLSQKVELAPGYLEALDQDIARLHQVMEVQNAQGDLSTRWVEQFKIQVRGRLTFAGFVLGKRSSTYLALKDRFYAALHPPEEEFGAVNWRSFPYNG